MTDLLFAALGGFVLGATFGALAHRRWVLLQLEERMIELGRDRGGPDFVEDEVEQDNSCSWPEIPLYDRRYPG
jgi:hypothetical protein